MKSNNTLQVLVSAMNANCQQLVEKMNIKSDAIIINQCDKVGYQEQHLNEGTVRFFDMNERGVGLSRNNALLRATGDIVLFSDEDITYDDDYVNKVLDAFEKHSDADMLLFNIRVCESRRTYYTTKETKIGWYNCGRYPTYSFAIRREKLHKSGVTYSLLFGGGAKYSAGEDSLFIKDLLRKKFKIIALPIEIGQEAERESTWFNGYTEKFFFDRGVLYHFLYGKLAKVFAYRFIMAKKSFMCKEIAPKKALSLMMDGIKEAKN